MTDTRNTPEAALWSLMKQGWRITAPGGSDVPPPALLAALDGWTLVPKTNPLSNFGDDENDRMPWQQDEYSEADRLRDAEIARLRAALEKIVWKPAHGGSIARAALAPVPSEHVQGEP